MLFADLNKNDYEKITYFDHNVGVHKFVFMTAPDNPGKIAKQVDIHYIPTIRAAILCTGETCKVCERNALILSENPDGKNDPKYYSRNQRFFAYIYNVTPVVICPVCSSNNVVLTSDGNGVCADCRTIIKDVHPAPLNKVQIFGFSKTLAGNINAVIIEELGGNVELLLKRPLVAKIIKSSSDNKKSYIFKVDNEEVEVPQIDLPPITRFITALTPDEQVMALQGISIREIYSLRGSGKEQTEDEKAVNSGLDLDDRIKEMFG